MTTKLQNIKWPCFLSEHTVNSTSVLGLVFWWNFFLFFLKKKKKKVSKVCFALLFQCTSIKYILGRYDKKHHNNNTSRWVILGWGMLLFCLKVLNYWRSNLLSGYKLAAGFSASNHDEQTGFFRVTLQWPRGSTGALLCSYSCCCWSFRSNYLSVVCTAAFFGAYFRGQSCKWRDHHQPH